MSLKALGQASPALLAAGPCLLRSHLLQLPTIHRPQREGGAWQLHLAPLAAHHGGPRVLLSPWRLHTCLEYMLFVHTRHDRHHQGGHGLLTTRLYAIYTYAWLPANPTAPG
jgi:hypothetical protein